MEKKKRELIPGMKIRFERPLAHSLESISQIGLIECMSACGKILGVKIKDSQDNYLRLYIHRRQVVGVFVKKKKESKYPREIWVNFNKEISVNNTIHSSELSADNCINKEFSMFGKSIKYVLAKGQ